jgi:NADH-quinone oxidoreductase subunit N
MDLGSIESLRYFYPEGVLVLAILAVFVGDLVVREKELLGEVALVAAALAFVFSARLFGTDGGWLFHRMVVLDNFAVFFKALFALAVLGVVWMSLGSSEVKGQNQGEYYGLLLAAALGMFLMASAANLLMAYLALEFLSLVSYVLTGYLRRNRRSGEAALKYLIYGGVASGAMIYGMSWIFGLAGSMDYGEIHRALTQGAVQAPTLFIALILVLAGFGYKIAAVPFHMWAPDAYQGAPIPVAAFLAVGSKAAGFSLLARFFFPTISVAAQGGAWQFLPGVDWPKVLLAVSMMTMTLGNLAALNQTNLKRLLAYSGIAHAGYTLMGFVVLNDEGLKAALFYLVAYYLMTLGAFLVVMVVAESTGREDVEGCRGLAWRGGALPALAMGVFLFSLTGLPPLAGFIGKFYLFAAVVNEKLYFLALVGILNSVVSLYYYARILRAMFLESPEDGAAEVTCDWYNGSLLVLLGVATIAIGVYWAPLIRLADHSVRFFVG